MEVTSGYGCKAVAVAVSAIVVRVTMTLPVPELTIDTVVTQVAVVVV